MTAVVSDDLRALYQEVILDHYRTPRNYGSLDPADHTAEGYNPLCGDEIKIFLRMEGEVVTEAAFEGSGCAISTASASLMTEAVKGKTRAQAEELFGHFHSLVTRGESEGEDLGKLEALTGVKDYPMRVKCATLAWHALHSAFSDSDEPVTTE